MFDTAIPLFGAIPGGPEMIVILLVFVLLFGANKIPKLARSTGQAMGEFQRGRQEIDEELQNMKEGPSQDTSSEDTSSTSTTADDTSSASTSATTDETTEKSTN